ncbi:MAG: hypothetical protein ACE5JH_07295 [Acidobacteriota bacterium]
MAVVVLLLTQYSIIWRVRQPTRGEDARPVPIPAPGIPTVSEGPEAVKSFPSVGCRVIHERYGEGTIHKVEGVGKSSTLTVDFGPPRGVVIIVATRVKPAKPLAT